jgi:hypothetical protein
MNIRILISFILLSISGYCQQQMDIPWPTLANSDWPMIKHDPQFTGRSPYKGPQTPTIIWTKDMEYGIFSGPVIGNEGDLYFGSYYVFGDNFYSYTADGDLIWQYETGNGRAVQSGILIDSSNTIYFGSRDSCFYALNSDGSFKWKYKTSASIDQQVIPNIDLQGNIYVTNSKGELYSFDPDGNLNWSVLYTNSFVDKSPTFSPDGNTIYIAGFDSNFFALNLDGSLKWEYSCEQIERGSMVDSYGKIYFTAGQYLYSINPTGSINWKYYLIGSPIAIPTIDKKSYIYTMAWDTTSGPYFPALVCLRYDGTISWKYIFDEIQWDHFEQPLICDSEGTIYLGSTFGYNYYAISNEGNLKWRLQLIEQQQQVDNTGAIVKDGTLFIGVHDVSLFGHQTKTLIAIRDTGTVSVNENYAAINKYSLSQNYPNPFNPITTIEYTLPQTTLVIIKVYNILGEEVISLVNEEQLGGKHSVKFDGSSLPCGIYIYKLTAGNFSDAKKFVLMK